MSKYDFTQDWFDRSIPVMEQIKKQLGKVGSVLEIGAYEGRSTVWLVENFLNDGGYVSSVDTWAGGEEHEKNSMPDVEIRFDKNVAEVQKMFPNRTVEKVKGLSSVELPALSVTKHAYDFVYVDGSHTAKDVLTDALMAWPMLKVGGVLLFDDYLWGDPRDILHRPKIAIDTFLDLFAEDIALMHVGYQVALKRMK